MPKNMPLKAKRVWLTPAGEKVRLGFDDPVRWASRLYKLATAKLHAVMTSPPVLAGCLVACLVVIADVIPTMDRTVDPRKPASMMVPVAAATKQDDRKQDDRALEPAEPAAVRLTDRLGANETAVMALELRTGVILSPPFEIADGRTFGNSELSVRLTDVDAPEREAVCIGDNGFPWACGLAARAALNNKIRVAPVTCSAMVGATRPVDGQCQLANGTSLAAQLVASGFARPTQPGQFADELADARKQKRGLWNGNWTYRPPASPSAP
jgi:endonuclease YncB( thermonuclease family)